jgi:hypothetical protein
MPGKTIHEPCCICGKTKEEGFKLGRFEGKVYCTKHLEDMKKFGKIRPSYRNILTTCCICKEPSRSTWKDGKQYCQRHYMQLYNNGHLLNRTIFDKNEYIDHPEEGYTECITYNKDFNESYRVILDLDKKDLLKNYKIYVRSREDKKYAMITYNGKKLFVHRFLMGITHTDYVLSVTIDHINGNGLDNRISNLRVCSQKDNMKNIRKDYKFVGVSWLKTTHKWTARIMSNYKTLHLGNYNTYEEAILARLRKEQELCGEFGPNKELYYIINHPSPIEEIKKALEGV